MDKVKLPFRSSKFIKNNLIEWDSYLRLFLSVKQWCEISRVALIYEWNVISDSFLELFILWNFKWNGCCLHCILVVFPSNERTDPLSPVTSDYRFVSLRFEKKEMDFHLSTDFWYRHFNSFKLETDFLPVVILWIFLRGQPLQDSYDSVVWSIRKRIFLELWNSISK